MENNKEKLIEIKIWLNSNSEKSDQEIRDFLYKEMGSDDFKESWTKHYFLEELKSPTNGFSERILKIIKNVQKEINGVPMSKRYIATIIDFIIIGVIVSFFEPMGVDNPIVEILIYLLYFSIVTYIFKTTIGLYIFKIKIEFEKNNLLFLRILWREILWLSTGTGIGFIIYLIKGPYWDKITKAKAVWIN